MRCSYTLHWQVQTLQLSPRAAVLWLSWRLDDKKINTSIEATDHGSTSWPASCHSHMQSALRQTALANSVSRQSAQYALESWNLKLPHHITGWRTPARPPEWHWPSSPLVYRTTSTDADLKVNWVFNAPNWVRNSQHFVTLCKNELYSIFNLSGEICIFEDKSARRMGYMTQSAILPVTSPNVHQF